MDLRRLAPDPKERARRLIARSRTSVGMSMVTAAEQSVKYAGRWGQCAPAVAARRPTTGHGVIDYRPAIRRVSPVMSWQLHAEEAAASHAARP